MILSRASIVTGDEARCGDTAVVPSAVANLQRLFGRTGRLPTDRGPVSWRTLPIARRIDAGSPTDYESGVAKNSRVPPAVSSIPVVGDLVKQADAQAQWLQDMVEQNARLVGQLPSTLKSFNDSLEQFNKTV